MTRLALSAIAALTLSACATGPRTPDDFAAISRLHPLTVELARQCANEYRNCRTAENVIARDPAATPRVMSMFYAADRGDWMKEYLRTFLQGAILGPESSIRSCYAGECVTTRYRVTTEGRVNSVRSY